MIVLLARLLAAAWALLTLVSLAAGLQVLFGPDRSNSVKALLAFLAKVLPLTRWQRIVSRVLPLLLFRAFFTSSVNTDIWPWAVIAWIALTFQLLGLKAHLTGYVEIIERGFDRPVNRYVAGHVALDVIVLIFTIAIATIGLT